jgi:hypothetical protein
MPVSTPSWSLAKTCSNWPRKVDTLVVLDRKGERAVYGIEVVVAGGMPSVAVVMALIVLEGSLAVRGARTKAPA